MHGNGVIYAVIAFIVILASFLLYNYFHNLRPYREKKIAMALSGNEELILSLICRASGSASQTSLLRDLPGLENPGKYYHILGRLQERGCIIKSGTSHYHATGRGKRIMALLGAAKNKRGN